jgi:flagellar biosynthesis GTPase FlhF
LQQCKEYHAGAVFWSPRKIREVQAHETVLQQQEHEDKVAKANRNELQAAAKLLKEQEKEECCVARERAKEVRDQMKAKQATARAAKIAAQNTIKSSCKRLDLCWPQWVHFGSQEYYRTLWNSMESHGTS